MVMFFYVDTNERVKEPKLGKQYVAWYTKGSISSPQGYPHVDVINGEEVQIRSFDEDKLTRWLRNVYQRAPYIKAMQVIEEEVDY